MEPSENRPATALAILRATLVGDRTAWLSLASAIVAVLVLSYLPAAQRASFGAVSVTAVFSALALLAARACRPGAGERGFWRDLMTAYCLWLVIALLLLWSVFSGTSARLAIEIGTAVFYVLFVRAVESQPDRQGGLASELTQRLNLAAIVVFVFGLLTYFWLIPGVLFRGEQQSLLLPSVYLYATLDALLTIRLFFLARAARSPLWRLLYSLLMTTTATMLAGDLVGSASSFAVANYFYAASMIFIVLAARSRLHEPDAAAAEPTEPFEHRSDRSWQTVIYTLTLPLLDLAIYRFGLLDPDFRSTRETFVLIWTPLLGVIALLQNRQLARERKRFLVELQAKNEEMERFTYAVSHDLKAPLVTVQGFLGMLEKDVAAGKPNRVQADIERISNAARNMGRLVDELLELSRIGRVVNRSEEVSLCSVAAEAEERLTAEISDRGVELVISSDLPVVVGDRVRLVQVFQNLIENAVKYMGSQSDPRIEVSRRRRGGENVYFVRDNGLGIDPRYQATVFDLFSRLETDVAGTGVGLALVKRIVESHGGRIWVESDGQEKGSTFCFTLGGSGTHASG
ncbi:MAG: GHKL domain-containing protein [bacterium]|nr:GHKL domain-containing protein [bacterium]